KDHVVALCRRPSRNVAGEPLRVDAGAARLIEHRLGRVETFEMRFRPAPREQCGRVTGTAAEIDDAARAFVRDTHEQLGSRPRAFVFEVQIDFRVPRHGQRSSRSGMSIRKIVLPAIDATNSISPPCNRARSRAMARPSPEPPARAPVANGWNNF